MKSSVEKKSFNDARLREKGEIERGEREAIQPIDRKKKVGERGRKNINEYY